MSELTPDLDDESLGELVLAHAEILGWLQGLLQAVELVLAQSAETATATGPAEAPPPGPRPDPGYL